MGMGAGRAALKNQGQGGQELLRSQCQLLQSPYGSCDSVNPKKQGQSFRLFFCGIVNGILGEGNGTPLQYSCLENPMDKGAW